MSFPLWNKGKPKDIYSTLMISFWLRKLNDICSRQKLKKYSWITFITLNADLNRKLIWNHRLYYHYHTNNVYIFLLAQAAINVVIASIYGMWILDILIQGNLKTMDTLSFKKNVDICRLSKQALNIQEKLSFDYSDNTTTLNMIII